MGKKTKLILILSTFVLIIVGIYFFSETAPWEIPALHARRSSKAYCSCRFVIKDSLENCQRKILDIIPFGELKEESGIVRMKFLWAESEAYLENKKLGCKLR